MARPSIKKVDSDVEQTLVTKVVDSYKASFMHKESKSLPELWKDCENYWAGDINLPEDDDDPASETNIVSPIIESQVADLVDGAMDMTVKGGPSEEPYLEEEKQRLKWIWTKNHMVPKLDDGERDRLKFGTIGWKVWWDHEAFNSRGLVTMDPCSPDQLFPDPKITDPRKIAMGDYFIHVMDYPLSYFRRRFGERGKLIQPEGKFQEDNPHLFGEDDAAAGEIINSSARLYEYWEMAEDENDSGLVALRKVYATKDILLEDSDWIFMDPQTHERRPCLKCNRYPFIMIPCYRKKGSLWGKGDAEILMPTQDIINDLDDQIRSNARLMGNLQVVVGLGAGINLKKWTNTPGLKIAAKDYSAWKTVEPANFPAYIYQRRQQAFTESEIVSGRPDVTEGRRSGSLRAASAILALQEAGNRRAKHKKLMLQEGFSEVMELVSEFMREFMVEETSFDMSEGGKKSHLWSRPSDMNNIPVKTLNENFTPLKDTPDTAMYKDMLQEKIGEDNKPVTMTDPITNLETPVMEPMTKEAEFQYEFSFGAGLPNNPQFIYQSTIELHREGLLTAEESRRTLKEILNWPTIIDPAMPEGTMDGRNLSPEQMLAANGIVPGQPGQSGQVGPEGPQQAPEGEAPGGGEVSPELLEQLVAALQGGGV